MLTDDKGPYGIGFRTKAGSESEPGLDVPDDVVLRPDRVSPIIRTPNRPFGFESFDIPEQSGNPDFCTLMESAYVDVQAYIVARRAGMSHARITSVNSETNPEVRRRVEDKLDGFREQAFEIVNSVLVAALNTCVSSELLGLVRQFRHQDRYRVYTHVANSPRLAQLLTAFPVLGLKLTVSSADAELPTEAIAMASTMVEDGRKLSDIAATMRVPMAMRKFNATDAHGYVHLSSRVFDCGSHLPDFFQRNSKRALAWITSIADAHDIHPDYAIWCARNFHNLDIEEQQIRGELRNIGDWVRACYEADLNDHIDRPFVPTMSARTVRRLSQDWHQGFSARCDRFWLLSENDAIPTDEQKEKLAAEKFPQPWITGSEIDGITIRPVVNCLALLEASRQLKNCGSSFSRAMHQGECCIYLVYRYEKLVTMIELRKRHRRYEIVQCKGYRNHSPDEDILDAIKQWQKSFPMIPEPTWEEIYSTWEREIVPTDIAKFSKASISRRPAPTEPPERLGTPNEPDAPEGNEFDGVWEIDWQWEDEIGHQTRDLVHRQ